MPHILSGNLLCSLALSGTITAMGKTRTLMARRRSKQRLTRKTFVYFTKEEREIVDQAAHAERRSVSSFIANAAMLAAEEVLIRKGRKT